MLGLLGLKQASMLLSWFVDHCVIYCPSDKTLKFSYADVGSCEAMLCGFPSFRRHVG